VKELLFFLTFNNKLDTWHNFASFRKIQFIIKYLPTNGTHALSIN